jgi:hypothetical protein
MNWKCGMCYVDGILAVGENVDKHLYHLKCDFALKRQPIARRGVHWCRPRENVSSRHFSCKTLTKFILGFQSCAIISYMSFMDFWKIITMWLAIDLYVNINQCLVWEFSLCVMILEPILMLNVWSRHVTSFDAICTVLCKWGFHDGGKSCNRRSLHFLLP